MVDSVVLIPHAWKCRSVKLDNRPTPGVVGQSYSGFDDSTW
jgi:hypothetical protein